MEFSKTRRRKIWLIVAALVATQLMWALWALRRMDAHALQQGWMYCLYQMPLLNTIMMPVITAVIASRLSDVEHKGQTFKLLGTVMPIGQLFDAKFLCGAIYTFSAVVLQLMVILLIGITKRFTGEIPVLMMGYYLLFTTGVSLTLLLVQQVLSILFANQMVSLSVGLIGAFAGLFSMFLPQGFQKLLLWSYYGVLMSVGMDWDRSTRIINLHWVPIDGSGFVLLAGFFCVIYITGRILFVKKEL
jgi:hypothetical protein